MKRKREGSTALYSSSPRNRRTSSSVCKAGALVSPSSCLDGEPHGWVPVDTHSTPVPSMTGEAVGGLCNVYEPNRPQESAQPVHGSGAEVQDHDPGTSQLSSETVSRTAPPGSEPSEDDGSSPPSMEQSEAAAPATPSLTTKHSRDAGEYHVAHTVR